MTDLLPTVEMNVLDRAIAAISPERAARRMRARMFLGMLDKYTGASTTRRALKAFNPVIGDADTDDLGSLKTLRARSRDLYRNNPMARGAIQTKVTSVVGSGLKLQSRVNAAVLGIDERTASEWQRDVEFKFNMWAASPNCDAMRAVDFYAQQDLAWRSTLTSGDVLAVMPTVRRAGWPFRLAVQLIEADRISNPGGKPDTRTLVEGVAKSSDGEVLGYHVAKIHPGASRTRNRDANDWTYVPAFGSRSGRRNAVHLIYRERIGQTRGVPDLASIIEPLKQLGRYSDAELAAAVVSSMFTVFVTSPVGGGLGPMEPTDETGAASTDADVRLGSGAVVETMPGSDIKFADPTRPNTAFDGFVMSFSRQIGMALELPYEVLVKHFTASYSAARAALLEAWRFFMTRRRWLARAFCQPIYEAWLEDAVAIGLIDAPGFVDDPFARAAWCAADWPGDGKGQINEKVETDAAVARIEAGLSTGQREAAEINGSDYESNVQQLAAEKRMREDAGLSVAAPAMPIVDGEDGNGDPDAPDEPDRN